jgi:hypothetical protein
MPNANLLLARDDTVRCLHEAAHAVIALALGGYVQAIVLGGDKPFRHEGKRKPAGSAFVLLGAPACWPERKRALLLCQVSQAGMAAGALLHAVLPPLSAGYHYVMDFAQFEDILRQWGWEHQRTRLMRWAAVLVMRHADDIRALGSLLLHWGERGTRRRLDGAHVRLFLLLMAAERRIRPRTSERERVKRVVDGYAHALSHASRRKQVRALVQSMPAAVLAELLASPPASTDVTNHVSGRRGRMPRTQ